MAICAKADGTPRRTLELQALNVHAVRETHHTQSPFHQARYVPHNKKNSVTLHPDDRHYTPSLHHGVGTCTSECLKDT